MKRNTIGLLSATALLLAAAPIAAADESDTIASAITSGKAGLNVRARYEGVDKDNALKDANALTARLRLNYKTGEWQGWSAFAEYDHVFHMIRDFNAGGGTTPDKGNYQTVADPKGSDLNQLYVDYKFDDDWMIRAGRQRVLLDNQRFVGGVGWRQNEQTYDALTVSTTAIANTTLVYGYVGQVRRIFGQSAAVPASKMNVDTHLLNAKVKINDSWSVTPYMYYIDNKDAAATSTSTFGARLTGGIKAGEGKVALVAELATQSDAGNNPVSYDADYAHLSALWSMDNGLGLGIAYESLGTDSSNFQSFRTPLATLHAFQGWADMFLSTPPSGIDDLYATIKFKAGKWNLTGVYHDFSAETGGGDFGTEFDLSAGTKLSGNYGLLFKGAFFSSDDVAYPDTNKFWIMFTANY
ncbi:MAG: porin [Gammaproteobacteria bacterium]|nr:porin [Gammaproteobacteria bacterium]